MWWLMIWLAAFALGSIPTGYLVVFSTKGMNIQKFGSGNIGSTNVGRVAGKGWALLTQAVDVGKGALATGLAMLWNHFYPTPYLVAGATLLVVLGNAYTPFLRFRGGKGVNTTCGAFLPLFPLAVGLAYVVHFAMRKLTGLVSLASIVAGLVLVLTAWLIYGWQPAMWALLLAFGLVCWRHAENIKRLWSGKETRERR